jgi:hypothetical protein
MTRRVSNSYHCISRHTLRSPARFAKSSALIQMLLGTTGAHSMFSWQGHCKNASPVSPPVATYSSGFLLRQIHRGRKELLRPPPIHWRLVESQLKLDRCQTGVFCGLAAVHLRYRHSGGAHRNERHRVSQTAGTRPGTTVTVVFCGNDMEWENRGSGTVSWIAVFIGAVAGSKGISPIAI